MQDNSGAINQKRLASDTIVGRFLTENKKKIINSTKCGCTEWYYIKFMSVVPLTEQEGVQAALQSPVSGP